MKTTQLRNKHWCHTKLVFNFWTNKITIIPLWSFYKVMTTLLKIVYPDFSTPKTTSKTILLELNTKWMTSSRWYYQRAPCSLRAANNYSFVPKILKIKWQFKLLSQVPHLLSRTISKLRFWQSQLSKEKWAVVDKLLPIRRLTTQLSSLIACSAQCLNF